MTQGFSVARKQQRACNCRFRLHSSTHSPIHSTPLPPLPTQKQVHAMHAALAAQTSMQEQGARLFIPILVLTMLHPQRI
jgi:hypothetical protein